MYKSINTPYTKSSGIEITKDKPYLTQGENRRQRRHKEAPFIGNGKQYPLTVSGTQKYVRFIQHVPVKTIIDPQNLRSRKTVGGNKILHYLAA